MSPLQHDQVIDDDELETCPLCIEEFDLSDRSFYPCPCSYQVRQSRYTEPLSLSVLTDNFRYASSATTTSRRL